MNKNRPYALFIDDVRMPNVAYLYGQRKNLIDESRIPQGSWDIVRSYDEFADYIRKNGVPLTISFDNDLCEDHVKYYFEAVASGVFEWRGASPKMGIHCLELILNICKNNEMPLPKIFIHSANHFGRAEMEAMLEINKKCLDSFSEGGILLPE
jgi:hypothetical protein